MSTTYIAKVQRKHLPTLGRRLRCATQLRIREIRVSQMRDLPGKSDNLDPGFLTRGNLRFLALFGPRSKASAKGGLALRQERNRTLISPLAPNMPQQLLFSPVGRVNKGMKTAGRIVRKFTPVSETFRRAAISRKIVGGVDFIK